MVPVFSALPAILPLVVALWAPAENAVALKKLSVARYAHSLAADQFKSPGEHALPNAFDGDPATIWWVPAAAMGDPGYTVEALFAAPVQLDQVRIVVDPPMPPAKGHHGRFIKVELNFWDRSLSTQYPIYKRMLSIPADRPSADLAIPNTAKWNAQLINDDGFGDKRRAKGYGDNVPYPITIDSLSMVVQDTLTADLPATIADVQLMLHGQPLPYAGVEELKAKHRAFIETGIKHITEGRYFVSPARTVQFGYSGGLYEITAANWTAGLVDDKNRKKLGTWRIEGGRLEIAPGNGKKFEPVDYAFDDAPTHVVLRNSVAAGEYAVATRAPAAPNAAPASEPAPAAPALTNTPGYEPPPLLE